MKTILTTLIAITIAAASSQAQTPTPTPTPWPAGPNFTVTWDASVGATSYTVGSGTVSKTYPTTVTSSTVSQSFTNVPAGKLYIAVKAKNNAGQESAYSSEISVMVTTAPLPPGNLRVTDSGLVNISTRGLVADGDNVMIGGFILTQPERVAVRAIGPSLGAAGVKGALTEANIDLLDRQGTVLRSNHGWETGPDAQALRDAAIAPTSSKESALIASLSPGNYTAIVSGAPVPGVGLVEVYKLDSP
ncbi:MAG: hypothetical protein H0X34_17905 [Chthoniobacterales bacterium]|nr:hypothetical protein [Chthoniobacterales bacterium]